MRWGRASAQILFVMSGGTEGILSPHLTVFTRQVEGLEGPTQMGLTLGVFHTRDFAVEEIGTLAMVEVVAEGVRQASAAAKLTPENVHFVQIKCPLITASSANETAITQDSYKSMAYSRGASALGVAIALGEISLEQLSANDICTNCQLYSSVASTSAGVELQNCEILVLGNSPSAHSHYRIGHSVMAHALDTEAVQRALSSVKGTPRTSSDPGNIINVFAKAEASPTGQVLGCRNTMLDDSDINHTRMARAVVGAMIASIVQDPTIYVSGGGEHQGPPGGGPVAVISRH